MGLGGCCCLSCVGIVFYQLVIQSRPKKSAATVLGYQNLQGNAGSINQGPANFCISCGAKRTGGATFCSGCGTRV